MSRQRIRIEEVLVYLGAQGGGPFLEHLRQEGLFEAEELDPDEAEELRLAKLLMDELGVNAAGVEVALHLRRRLLALELRTHALADALAESRRDSPGPARTR